MRKWLKRHAAAIYVLVVFWLILCAVIGLVARESFKATRDTTPASAEYLYEFMDSIEVKK